MIKNPLRPTAAYNLQVALNAPEATKTISRSPNDRAPEEDPFSPRRWQPARHRSGLAPVLRGRIRSNSQLYHLQMSFPCRFLASQWQ